MDPWKHYEQLPMVSKQALEMLPRKRVTHPGELLHLSGDVTLQLSGACPLVYR